MGIFSRIGDVVKSNINDLIDRAEDPEKMVKQIILDLQKEVSNATTALGKAKASERIAKRQYDDAVKTSADWEMKAKAALNAGEVDLAKKALSNKVKADESVKQYQQMYEQIAAQTAQLQEQVETLKSKLETYAGGIVGNYFVKVTEKDGKLFIGVSSKNTNGTEKDRLVTYTIENEKVTAIKWEAVCGADDYNTIKAYFNLEIGTPVSRDAINKNFGWDNKVESCFQWSKNGAAITNPECKVEIPKTGDASVIAYAVMALVAAAGAMGLKK